MKTSGAQAQKGWKALDNQGSVIVRRVAPTDGATGGEGGVSFKKTWHGPNTPEGGILGEGETVTEGAGNRKEKKACLGSLTRIRGATRHREGARKRPNANKQGKKRRKP